MWRDEKAVSPVIGVILMVAITVILAAVIASFVFGLGSKAPKSAPQAQLVASADADNTNYNGKVDLVVIEHQGGENIPWDDIKVLVEGKNTSAVTDAENININVFGNWTADNIGKQGIYWNQSEISRNQFWEPGEKLLIGFNDSHNNMFDPGETVTIKVLHTPSNQLILSTQVPAQ